MTAEVLVSPEQLKGVSASRSCRGSRMDERRHNKTDGTTANGSRVAASELNLRGEIAADAPNAIAVEHIVKRYGTFTAVDDISFAVKEGEIFGLLGPNGAGKSTLIRMMTTLIPISGGHGCG